MNTYKDANGVDLNVNDDVMCLVPENNETSEYEGTILELLPENKIKVDAECRTFVLDASAVYSLMF